MSNTNHQIFYTPTVKEILENAETFKAKYRSSKASTLHALMAILNLYFDNPKRDDVRECVDMLGIKKKHLPIFLSVLSHHLSRHRMVSDSELLVWAEACALKKLLEGSEPEKVFSASCLMSEILSDQGGSLCILKEQLSEYVPHEKTKNTEEPSASSEPSSSVENTSENMSQAMPIAEEDFDELIFRDEEETALIKEPMSLVELVSKTNQIQAALLERVFGQDEAVSAFVSGYFHGEVTSRSQRSDSRPLATFLFAGAPGVGKTYLAECAAEQLKLPFKRFDMSGFSDKEAPLSFAGCDPVFKGAHAGLVTEFVAKNPKCVLLFDEIEKAHPTIIHLFLQILDAGILKDVYTKQNVSFKDAIIIMTTNVGRALYEGSAEPFFQTAVSRKVIINALVSEKNPQTLEPYFPAAICSRFAAGNIVLFNPLTAPDLICIAERRMYDFCRRFSSSQEIEIHLDKHVAPALLFSEGGKVDARSLKGKADAFISSEIYKWLKFSYARDPVKFTDLLAISVSVDVEEEGDAAWLFSEEETANVLLFSEREGVFRDIVGCEECRFFEANSVEKAKKIIASNEIDFVICDIICERSENTLNIEDTTSAGRKLFDFFVREEVPFYVFTEHKLQINAEERQALLEQKAHGFFECYGDFDAQEFLQEIKYEVSFERKLRRLSRANKVLTFDCSYEWADDELGLIRLKGLHVTPAVDAEDQKEIAPADVSNVTFDQIIGAEDVKEELKSFLSFLREPREYARLGIPAPKGILLYGPPGTGKTMLAKALAHEAGTAFIAAEGNEFIKTFYGGAGESVHAIFQKARKYAPCILFVDEFDAIAMNRMTPHASPAAHEAINAFLNEMDGFSTNPNKPVFVLAATNFDASFGKDGSLDPAVLRRFDRRIFVDLPNREERKVFVRQRLSRSNQKMDEDTLENFALRTVGMSLAEIGLVVDCSLRDMLRTGKSILTGEMLGEALEVFCFGEERDKNEAAAKRTALHEAGHAFVNWHYGSKPHYITISGRGDFGGYTQVEIEDSLVKTERDLKNKICTCLAGRAAEMVFFGERDGVSTGAASDLRVATKIALKMITEFGMTREYGLASFPSSEPDDASLEICNKILCDQLNVALQLLEENKEVVSRLADALVKKNHLMKNEIEKIFTTEGEK